MKKRKVIEIMRTQFRVWEGTDNALDVLDDTARAIGHRGFGLVANDLNDFASKCMAPERTSK